MESIIKISPDNTSIIVFNKGIEITKFIEIKIKFFSFGCMNADQILKSDPSSEIDTLINYETSFKLKLLDCEPQKL